MSNNKQSSVDKEFVPYEEALALKKLGFDEPCFAVYFNTTQQLYFDKYINEFNKDVRTLSPTFSQAFRWFREKYKMHIINPDFGSKFEYKIFNLHLLKQGKESGKTGFNTYEEAELACLKKLIKMQGGNNE